MLLSYNHVFKGKQCYAMCVYCEDADVENNRGEKRNDAKKWYSTRSTCIFGQNRIYSIT